MNLLTIILLGSALWVIYSLMESYNLLIKEIKELKRKLNMSESEINSENNNYNINKKTRDLKNNLLLGLKSLMNV